MLANRSEIEAVMQGDVAFPLHEVAFERLPRSGWAVGMAVRKDDLEIAKKLQAAMNELVASGERKAIFAKHGVKAVTP